eukprot:TRINITY_DN450405_c0_g2_i1.p1 TRINITY_DN450405_c0_g2~~TRINITY_DN450405_c0_g2_i1.p1  ORF type:complete len:629 (+),score=179.41 TRINITY_DN450405_c0_g2_i1:241-1887(+)
MAAEAMGLSLNLASRNIPGSSSAFVTSQSSNGANNGDPTISASRAFSEMTVLSAGTPLSHVRSGSGTELGQHTPKDVGEHLRSDSDTVLSRHSGSRELMEKIPLTLTGEGLRRPDVVRTPGQKLNTRAVNFCNEYSVLAGEKLNNWLTNIIEEMMNNPTNWEPDEDGACRTFAPEDASVLINEQVAIASEHVNGESLQRIILHLFLQLLSFYQSIQHWLEEEDSSAFSIEYLCAIINDCERMDDHIQESVQEASSKLPDKLAEELEQGTEVTFAAMRDTAMEAVCKSAQIVFDDLDDPVSSKLFTDEWIVGVDVHVKSICETFKDYLDDFHFKWLSSDYYFAFVVKELLIMTNEMYLKQFSVASEVSELPLENVIVTLKQDVELLEQYFLSEHTETLRRAGLQNGIEIVEVLEPIHILLEFLEAPDPIIPAQTLMTKCPRDIREDLSSKLLSVRSNLNIETVDELTKLLKKKPTKKRQLMKQGLAWIRRKRHSRALSDNSSVGSGSKASHDVPSSVDVDSQPVSVSMDDFLNSDHQGVLSDIEESDRL